MKENALLNLNVINPKTLDNQSRFSKITSVMIVPQFFQACDILINTGECNSKILRRVIGTELLAKYYRFRLRITMDGNLI